MERNSVIIQNLINKDTAIKNLLAKYSIAEGAAFDADTFSAIPEIELTKLLGLTMQFVFNQLKAPTVKDTFDESGIVETFSEPNAMYLQRIHYNAIKQIGPFYQAENTTIPSQFDKRLATTVERFFAKNMDYQNLITQLDKQTVQRIFASEFGLASFLSGPAMVLESSYKLYKTLTVYEVLNSILNNTNYVLKDTQKLNVVLSDTPSKEDLREFILMIKNKISEMDMFPSTDRYNAGGYTHFFDRSNHVLLLKPGVRNMIATHLLENSYNMDQLDLPIEVRECMHFGGLQPTSDGTTSVYPVYDKWASLIGFNTVANKTVVTVQEGDVIWVDPNENVIGMIVEKGVIVYNDANPLEIEMARNSLGLFTNMIANKPGCSLNYDPDYNTVVIYNTEYAGEIFINRVTPGDTAGTSIVFTETNPPQGHSYLYTVTKTPVVGVRKNEIINDDATPMMNNVTEIPVESGDYINIFEVINGTDEITKYTSILVTTVNIGV